MYPISTILHVPRSVRPLLAETLVTELRRACSHNVWGTVHLPKAILHSPPVSVKKKRVVMATLISQRLKPWSTDNDVYGLWKEALSDCSHPILKRNQGPSLLDGTPVEGVDSLAAFNAVCALRWAYEGRYGNAICALESLGTAAFSDDLAWAELLKCHPSNNLPSFDNDIPSSLTMDKLLFAHCVAFPVVLVLEVLVSEHNTFLTQSAGIPPLPHKIACML